MSIKMAEVSMQKAFDSLIPGCMEASWVVGLTNSLGNIYYGSGVDKRLHSCCRVQEDGESNICYDLIAKIGNSFMDSTGKAKPTSAVQAAGAAIRISGLTSLYEVMSSFAVGMTTHYTDPKQKRNVVCILGTNMWHICSADIRTTTHYEYIDRLGDCNKINCGAVIKHSHKIDADKIVVADFNKIKLRHSTPSLIKPRRRDAELLGIFTGDWEYAPNATLAIERG